MDSFSVLKFLLLQLEGDGNFEFENKAGIFFLIPPSGVGEEPQIMINAAYPGYNGDGLDVELDLSFKYEDEETLKKDFNIRNEQDLHDLPIQSLIEAYKKGRMGIACVIGSGQTLSFQKSGEALMACYEDKDRFHRVQEELTTPEDYVAYAMN